MKEFDFTYNTRVALSYSDSDRAAKADEGITGRRLTRLNSKIPTVIEMLIGCCIKKAPAPKSRGFKTRLKLDRVNLAVSAGAYQ